MALYDSHTMTAALNIMPRAQSFFLDTFFTRSETSWSEFVDIDIRRGTQRLAPFVNPLSPGKIEERGGYNTRIYRPPYLKPKRISSVADWIKRMPGENPFTNRSVMERAAELMSNDLAEMDEEVLRREEWMAVQALTTGKVVVRGEGLSAEIDFLWSATHLLAAASLTAGGWDQAGANPIADAEIQSQLIIADGGMTPDVWIMGTAAWNLFLGNTFVQSYLDKQRLVLGEIAPQANRMGARRMGSILGLDLYQYNEWYIDENGVKQPLFPPDYTLMGSRAARCVRHYGAILDPKATGQGGAPPRTFAKSWDEEDPPAKYVMVQSAPLPVVHEPDGFVRADVVG